MAYARRLSVSPGWALMLGMVWFALCLLGFNGLLWLAVNGG
jgi:hypothetical protein